LQRKNAREERRRKMNERSPRLVCQKFKRLLVATRALARLEIILSKDGTPESALSWGFIDGYSKRVPCTCRSRYEEEEKAERMRLATSTSNGCQKKKKKGKGKKKSGKEKKKSTKNSENMDINIGETQDMEMSPSADWEEAASLLYGVAVLMLKHNVAEECLRDIVLQMGEEEARKYFLEIARSS
jgi:hypothetical protein